MTSHLMLVLAASAVFCGLIAIFFDPVRRTTIRTWLADNNYRNLSRVLFGSGIAGALMLLGWGAILQPWVALLVLVGVIVAIAATYHWDAMKTFFIANGQRWSGWLFRPVIIVLVLVLLAWAVVGSIPPINNMTNRLRRQVTWTPLAPSAPTVLPSGPDGSNLASRESPDDCKWRIANVNGWEPNSQRVHDEMQRQGCR